MILLYRMNFWNKIAWLSNQISTQFNKKLGDYIISENKPCIIVINKWDLVKGIETNKYNDYIYKCLPGLSFSPISVISAKNNAHIKEMVHLALDLYEQANTRITTSELNQALEEALTLHRPTRHKSKAPRIYYATQVSAAPPTFVLFVNDPKLFDSDYERYLSNQLRKKLPFSEIPLKFYYRARTQTQLSHAWRMRLLIWIRLSYIVSELKLILLSFRLKGKGGMDKVACPCIIWFVCNKTGKDRLWIIIKIYSRASKYNSFAIFVYWPQFHCSSFVL